MKTVEINRYNNDVILVTLEHSILFGLFKFRKRYISTTKYMDGLWNWKKLPNMTRVKPIDALYFNIICQKKEEHVPTSNSFEKDISRLILNLHELMWMTKSNKVKDAYRYSINELHSILNNNGL